MFISKSENASFNLSVADYKYDRDYTVQTFKISKDIVAVADLCVVKDDQESLGVEFRTYSGSECRISKMSF